MASDARDGRPSSHAAACGPGEFGGPDAPCSTPHLRSESLAPASSCPGSARVLRGRCPVCASCERREHHVPLTPVGAAADRTRDRAVARRAGARRYDRETHRPRYGRQEAAPGRRQHPDRGTATRGHHGRSGWILHHRHPRRTLLRAREPHRLHEHPRRERRDLARLLDHARRLAEARGRADERGRRQRRAAAAAEGRHRHDPVHQRVRHPEAADTRLPGCRRAADRRRQLQAADRQRDAERQHADHPRRPPERDRILCRRLLAAARRSATTPSRRSCC